MLRFTVVGLFQGATYGLLAAGLVLVYRATVVVNFALAEFGGIAAFVGYGTFTGLGIPYGPAALAGIAAAVGAGVIAERLFVRPLADGPRLATLVGTVAVAVVVIGATIVVARNEARVLPPALGSVSYVILGAGISRQLLLLAGVAIVSLVALWAIGARTGAWMAFRASADDPMPAAAAGVRSSWASRSAWAVGAALGGVAGVLQAPVHGSFYPGFMTLETLLPALTAALLGGMTSVVGAFAAGEVVGVAQSLGDYLLGQRLGVPGAANLAVFALLVAAMLIRVDDPPLERVFG